MQRKGNTFAPLVGMQTGVTTLKNTIEVPEKLKIKLPYDPAIAPLGIYPKDTKMLIEWAHALNVSSSTINNSQIMERTQMSID